MIKVVGAWLHTGQSNDMAGFTLRDFAIALKGPSVAGTNKSQKVHGNCISYYGVVFLHGFVQGAAHQVLAKEEIV